MGPFELSYIMEEIKRVKRRLRIVSDRIANRKESIYYCTGDPADWWAAQDEDRNERGALLRNQSRLIAATK